MGNKLSFSEFSKSICIIIDEYKDRDDIYYLSGTKELEKSYSLIAIYRWYEVYEFLCSIPNANALSILDVGVTPFTFFLKKHGFANVQALDLSNVSEERCRLYEVPFFPGGLFTEDKNFEGRTYDVILFLEVIEHIHKNPVDVLNHLKHMLKASGLLYLTTPNLMVLSNRVKMLFNKKLDQLHYPPFQYNTVDHGPEHDRIYMPAELKMYCEEVNFSKYQLGYSTALERSRFRHRKLSSKMLQLVGFSVKKIFPSTASTIVLILTK